MKFNNLSVWKCNPGDSSKSDYGFSLQWSKKAFGFGEFLFYMKDGKLICDSEECRREIVLDALVAMLDAAEFVSERRTIFSGYDRYIKELEDEVVELKNKIKHLSSNK